LGARSTSASRTALAPVRALVRLKPRLHRLLWRQAESILGPGPSEAFARAEGENIMQRVVALACAALAFGMFGSPLGAQQTPSEQPMPQAAQPPPVPEAEPLPPPPPFPPMPSARPSHRWVDMGERHARRVQHPRTHHRRTHAHHRAAHKARLTHFSRRTIRSCHAMNFRQIMRHSSCRLLMRQELATTAAHRHHQATRHHKMAAHRARHHQAVSRRKR